jgi:hypothetical protein
MSDRVQVELTGSDVNGVWLTQDSRAGSDVHIYTSKTLDGVVVGQNKNYKDKVDFSDLALLLKKDKVELQYADEKGEPKFVEVNSSDVRDGLIYFLETLKEKAVRE